MPKIIDASSFFPENRPHGLPSDAPKPDFASLAARTKLLSAARKTPDDIAAILARENTRLGAGPATLDAVSSIDASTVFVVAGQQAGLFGGPLYTLYKAMHAVRLARRLSDASGRTVVPVFWVASDDHDFEEVSSLAIRTSDGSAGDMEYSPGGRRDGGPVGTIILDDSIAETLETFGRTLPQGDAGARYLEMLRRAWTPGRLWTDAFAMQMLELFRDHGLVLFDPRWDGVKSHFRDVFLKEIEVPGASSRLLNDEADSFESARMRKKALRKPEGSTNLFIETDGVRMPLMFDGGVFRAGETTFTSSELKTVIDSEPYRLGPAAAIRPVCQDALFPVAALISGPGERLYLSQLDAVYSLFGIERSTPWPRASFTVVDRRTMRVSDKEAIPPQELFAGIETILSTFAKSTFPERTARDLDALDTAISDGFERLAESIAEVDPTLVSAVEKERGRVLHITESLRERALRAHKASADVSTNRLQAASWFLLPDGSAQERSFGTDAILGVLADGGFDAILNAASPGEECHRIVLQEV